MHIVFISFLSVFALLLLYLWIKKITTNIFNSMLKRKVLKYRIVSINTNYSDNDYEKKLYYPQCYIIFRWFFFNPKTGVLYGKVPYVNKERAEVAVISFRTKVEEKRFGKENNTEIEMVFDPKYEAYREKPKNEPKNENNSEQRRNN